ncbi:MAG: hypothetical protein WB622_18365 [Acidobacteriaceae bacterium]
MAERDPHSEADVARYVEIEARDEKVLHVEKVKTEIAVGERFEIWDVTTDKERWWVITNLTNLYPQRLFPSLDYTLSFHIGLMMRLRSRPAGPTSDAPSPFDEVFRRQEQAKARFEAAVEPEDYQAVGMQLRECLISLMGALRRRTAISQTVDRPQDANVVGWSSLLADSLCPGGSNKELRQYIKGATKDTWQLVNWLTHDRNATERACSVAIHASDTVVGHFIQLLERNQSGDIDKCPHCQSRNIRTHFDPELGPDGSYYSTCKVCDWNNISDHDTIDPLLEPMRGTGEYS